MSKVEELKSFIFDDEVQKVFSDINDNLMDFNILEITGMGTQEIKHSNILGWLLEDSEHGLEYRILENFLKKVIEKNRVDENEKHLDNLKSYIYLSSNKKEITIYREKDNIDLLIVDEANKVVIAIENKVYASESKEQLKTYENVVEEKYNDYAKYFIFLTINLEEAKNNEKYWMKANHQMVTDVIEDILSTKHDIAIKSKIILESYVDILKRRGIVEDIELKKLCKKIWVDDKYKNALDVLMKHKTSRVKIFYDEVLSIREKVLNGNPQDYLELDGIKALYRTAKLDREAEEDILLEVTCQYNNDCITLDYVYGTHEKLQDKEIQDILKKVVGENIAKKYTKIKFDNKKEYRIENFKNRGEAEILKEIEETIDEVNKKLIEYCK